METIVIDTVQQGKEFHRHILQNFREISVTAEGSNLGPCGKLSLLAIGVEGIYGYECYIIDVFACPQLMQKQCLRDVLEATKILKVTYKCKNICSLLYAKHKETLMKPVFDIQCAHALIESQKNDCSPFDIPPISLSALCRKYQSNYTDYPVDEALWWQRPLPERALLAAAAKALCFFPSVYKCMRSLIHPKNMEKFFKMCSANVIFYIFPEAYDNEMDEFHSMRPSRVTVHDNKPNACPVIASKRKSVRGTGDSCGKQMKTRCPKSESKLFSQAVKKQSRLQSKMISKCGRMNAVSRLRSQCVARKTSSRAPCENGSDGKEKQKVWETISPNFLNSDGKCSEGTKQKCHSGENCTCQCKKCKTKK